MARNATCLFLLFLLILTPTPIKAQLNLPGEADTAWKLYLDESPRDQKTKDFLALRVTSFINNLERLQKQSITPNQPAQLEIEETLNHLERDYRMLEATIQNLQKLSYADGDTRTFDLKLITSFGMVLGQAGILARN